MGISIRPARLEDLPLLKTWDQETHNFLSDPEDWDWEEELRHPPQGQELLIAQEGSRPLGVLQIIDPAREESHYWGEVEPNLRAVDIWIGAKEDLGRGYGSQMMNLALSRCFEPQEVTAVIIDPLLSNTRAHRFYRRLGFRAQEVQDFQGQLCLVMRLDREQWAKVNGTHP
jgi:aminoglycoside 6'-N-acetyltransferase